MMDTKSSASPVIGEAARSIAMLLSLAACAADAVEGAPPFAAEATSAPEADTLEQRDQAVTVRGACNRSQSRALPVMHGWLTSMTEYGYQRFLADPTGQRAQRWFGVQNAQQRSQVAGTLFDMFDVMAHAPVDYICESGVGDRCERNPGWGAYVVSGESWKVHVCPRFWDLDNLGRGIVLAHEFAHFFYEGHVDLTVWFPDFQPADVNDPIHVATVALFPELAAQNPSNYAFYIQNFAQDPE